jgi:hypothetical protein
MILTDYLAVLLLLGAAAALIYAAFLVGPALGYCALGLGLLVVGMTLLRVQKGKR